MKKSAKTKACLDADEWYSSVGHDDLVVNYHDACLYGRDISLLYSNGWLNADCIHYQFKRLQQEFSPDLKHLLLDPSAVSFLMHQCNDDDEMSEFASGYIFFRTSERLFIPVNDNMMPSSQWNVTGLGTHWSLLVLLLSKKQAKVSNQSCWEISPYHYDSIPGSSNGQAASAVSIKFCKLFQDCIKGTVALNSIHHCTCPYQVNGYDCGMHVLATTEVLLRTTCTEEEVGVKLKGIFDQNPLFCSDLRQRIVHDVQIQIKSQYGMKAKSIT